MPAQALPNRVALVVNHENITNCYVRLQSLKVSRPLSALLRH